MRVEAEHSKYQEAPDLSDFSKAEIRHARLLLRRLRFLETNNENPRPEESGGAQFAMWEEAALEWALDELGFLAHDDDEEED